MLGFVSAVVVSALDKIGMRQLGLDGAIREESRKVVRTVPLKKEEKKKLFEYTFNCLCVCVCRGFRM